MTEPIPLLSTDAWVILSVLFVVALLFALLMVLLEHVATQWQADQYDAGQVPMEGQLTRRTLTPRIPAQRRPDGDVS